MTQERKDRTVNFHFRWRWGLLIILLLLVWATMYFRGMGEWYAQYIYPAVSLLLSRISSRFSFSVSDCFIYGSIAGLLIYLLHSFIKRKQYLKPLLRTGEYLLWVYVWLYLAWGLNYFRDNFYQRAEVKPAAYSEETFRTFLSDYTRLLNDNYSEYLSVDSQILDREVRNGYALISPKLKILQPGEWLRPKPMLFSPLMSSVGVKGYIGPFFIEYTLNKDLLPEEYSFTYAHEMAHVLGVSNEAEANLCGYLVCMNSRVEAVRYSALFALLPYVAGNTYQLLSDEDYKEWLATIRPEVRELYNDRRLHWQSLYSPLIGEVQDRLYNAFLKSNRIPSGTANYSEVIALLIAFQYNDEGSAAND